MGKTRHHYIPVFYLKGFTDPNRKNCLWVYDREEKRVFPSTPINIACKKDYYTFRCKDNAPDIDAAENLYSIIENDSAQVLTKIQKEYQLTEGDKSAFSSFVASMMVRVPHYRNNIEEGIAELVWKREKTLAANKKAFEASYETFLQATGTNQDISAEELRQSILKDEYIITTNPNVSLFFSVESILIFAELFRQMNWVFIKATEDYKFLSGDNPIFYVDQTISSHSFYGAGLGMKNIEVTLPLSRDYCAFGGWQNDGQYTSIPGKNNWVKNINRRTVMAASRYVFAEKKSDTILKFVLKHRKAAPTITFT